MFFMLFADILSVQTMKEAKQIVLDRTKDKKKTLVLLDVDMTVSFPDTQAVRYPAIKSNLFSYYRIRWSHGALTSSLITVLYPPVLVEKDTAKVIKQFGAPTILFTACASGRVGPIQSLKTVKYEGLKRLGVDFSKTFGKNFEGPVFYKGMLFSENEDEKGPVLVQFLKKMKLTGMKTIFLIDDRKSNIKDVRNALSEHCPDIEFVGLVYEGSQDVGGDISSSEFKKVWQHAADLAGEKCDQ